MAPADLPRRSAHTMRDCDLPPALFEDLVSAFRQDITVTRYASWAALLDYCRRSANPSAGSCCASAGWRDPELDDASDAVCTALQLTNFWQDLAIDWRAAGCTCRPRSTSRRRRAGRARSRRVDDRWRDALARAPARTRELFERGRAVCDGVPGRLRWELRATWLGGMRILDRLDASGYDVFRARPTLGAARRAVDRVASGEVAA